MANCLLTWQLAGRLLAEDVARIDPRLSSELLKAACRCGEDCGKIIGLMDERDPRAKLSLNGPLRLMGRR